MWVKFARAMAPLMMMPAKMIAEENVPSKAEGFRILDVAAGHGIFGIQSALANPKVEITAVDWPAVLEVAKENAKRFGVAERYRTIPGSAFEVEFGSGYQAVFITNFLHHFDPPTCEKFLRKVH